MRVHSQMHTSITWPRATTITYDLFCRLHLSTKRQSMKNMHFSARI